MTQHIKIPIDNRAKHLYFLRKKNASSVTAKSLNTKKLTSKYVNKRACGKSTLAEKTREMAMKSKMNKGVKFIHIKNNLNKKLCDTHYTCRTQMCGTQQGTL